MAKKSRKRAAKYSELSRAKRRRQAAGPGPQPQAVSTPKAQEVAATATAIKKSPALTKGPAVQRGPKTQPGFRLAISDYRYVRDDLKRIGILTGAVIVILIILAFVLG